MGTSQTTRRQLDATDSRMLRILERQGRIPNKALAHQLGIAQSTCATRLRALQEAGIVRAFRAELDMAALGRSLDAVVRVQLRTHCREDVCRFRDRVAGLPLVLEVLLVAGGGDFLVRIAVPDAAALHDVVSEQISAMTEVLRTETYVVLERIERTIFPSDGCSSPSSSADSHAQNSGRPRDL